MYLIVVMSLLAIDLGGTKLAVALFTESGSLKTRHVVSLNGKSGKHVADLMTQEIQAFLPSRNIDAIGVAVPGIYSAHNGTVWAPNIPGWNYYPLLNQLKSVAGHLPVVIDSDRACYISGEIWTGNAKGCSDAIFVAVGTGIGAGIVTGGHLVRGAQDIAGAIGWMALQPPYRDAFDQCGCFETYTSGEGIAKSYRAKLIAKKNRTGRGQRQLSARQVFELYASGDELALEVINDCIMFWGMAAANLVSMFNPQKIIFGGGVFGPAIPLVDSIKKEASKWAQPISMQQVEFTVSALGGDAGLYGAAYLALQAVNSKTMKNAL